MKLASNVRNIDCTIKYEQVLRRDSGRWTFHLVSNSRQEQGLPKIMDDSRWTMVDNVHKSNLRMKKPVGD